MVLEEPWSERAARRFRSKNCKALEIIWQNVENASSLDFLVDLKDVLLELSIWDITLRADPVMYELTRLRELTLNLKSKSVFDCSRFPQLVRLSGNVLCNEQDELFSPSLHEILVSGVSARNPIFDTPKLLHLRLLGGTANRWDFSGAPSLESLVIYRLKQRDHHQATWISALPPSLKTLNAEGNCGEFDLSLITHCQNLEIIHLESVGGIRNASALAKLPKLRGIYVTVNSSFLDPDLSWIRRCPSLEGICFKASRNYSLNPRDLPQYGLSVEFQSLERSVENRVEAALCGE